MAARHGAVIRRIGAADIIPLRRERRDRAQQSLN